MTFTVPIEIQGTTYHVIPFKDVAYPNTNIITWNQSQAQVVTNPSDQLLAFTFIAYSIEMPRTLPITILVYNDNYTVHVFNPTEFNTFDEFYQSHYGTDAHDVITFFVFTEPMTHAVYKYNACIPTTTPTDLTWEECQYELSQLYQYQSEVLGFNVRLLHMDARVWVSVVVAIVLICSFIFISIWYKRP